MDTTTRSLTFSNPYRPGAGHMPPYLAGRENEYREFDQLLKQKTILDNLVLTGLRGVGKTVLLDTFKPRAVQEGWGWVGTDLSESASISDANMATRLLADLAVATSNVEFEVPAPFPTGFNFGPGSPVKVPLDYDVLRMVYDQHPGLAADKLKQTLIFAHEQLAHNGRARLVFAYDEAQNLSDNSQRDEYPLSNLLDVFQSIQKMGIPFLLVLTGLPTLFPKLIEARTYAERMFRVVTLDRLNDEDSRAAILKPLQVSECPIRFDDGSVDVICKESGGYPYFIQFICREVFDVWVSQLADGKLGGVPVEAIKRKLDSDFFAGRWEKATDRQRDLLYVIASLEHADLEFTISEIVAKGREMLESPFSSSHANQMLVALAKRGLVYKNRFGKYSFAVPLLGGFIRRTLQKSSVQLPLFGQ